LISSYSRTRKIQSWRVDWRQRIQFYK
jgi:hypothetical protein